MPVDCHRLCLRNDKSERIYHQGSEEFEVTSCHCEEITKLATRQSIVSRNKLADYSVRFRYASGSPRAFSPRDDKPEGARDDKMKSIEQRANRSVS